LLVEDNPDVGQYLKTCLEDQYQLIMATDGGMGIEMAIEKIPDLIITDVMMPRKDGYQLTGELKSHEITNHIPIIILTGKFSLDSKIKGLGVDADVYLTKPFDSRELKAHIQTLLNNRKRLQEKYSREIKLSSETLSDPASKESLFLQKCIEVVETELSNDAFSIEDFADALAMSRTQLFRKLKALTNQSPSRFIRSIRLRHALNLIKADAATISEIAFQVGFGSTSYFNRVFKEEFGKAPGAYSPS
ncbi:MAG: response regulator, partial [Bacteroidota bacterium]